MRETIERTLGKVEVQMTSHAGHAITLARDAANAGSPLVVAVGGDGTFSEVVNGIMQSGKSSREEMGEGASPIESSRPSTAVGVIAQGTGGDFRRTLGIEHRLDRYLDALSSGRTRAIDVGKLRYRAFDGATRERYFVNILSAGMGGLVDRYVSEGSSRWGGKAAYFAASVRALARIERGNLRCRVTLDAVTTERNLATYVLAICNGRYFGSGMHVAPTAQLDDGVFDVVSIGGASKAGFALTSRKIYQGAHLGAPEVDHFRCQAIDIDLMNGDASSEFPLDVDGEALGGLPLSVSIVKKAVTLRA
ncbi:MAG: diacylglycerol kinase family lipid kinase [Polyangiales bacterium]